MPTTSTDAGRRGWLPAHVFKPVWIGVALVAAGAGCAQAQPVTPAASAPTSAAADAGTLADGEVRKVDKENGKITLKHGEIRNLEMPGMTMVFRVSDAAMLATVKPGDKIRFKAEKTQGAIVITEIHPVR